MDLKEWCEYMRDVKEIAHLTNAFIAEKADVSIKTIERIMASNRGRGVDSFRQRAISGVLTPYLHTADSDKRRDRHTQSRGSV